MNARNSGENGKSGVMTYQVRAQVYTDGGSSTTSNNAISVSGANSATIILGIATSFNNYRDGSGANPDSRNSATFSALPSTNFDTLFSRHRSIWQGFFNRFSIDLGNVQSLSSLATDVRVQRAMSTTDLGLISLFVNYGRALLIGSSGPLAVQPSNLQGIWQNGLTATWQSKFTVNINIEMNYWGAELWNLPEMVESVTKMMEDVAITGRETAQNLWGANSTAASSGYPPWVLHHNTDQWRATWPIDGAQWGMWPSGGLWMLQTLWEHYLHDPTNTNYARRIYPLFAGATQFFLETTVPYPGNSSWLVTNPSMSPERGHTGGTVCAGPTLDNALRRDVYQQTIQLANLLGVDSSYVSRINTAIGRIPPIKIGSGGQVQEWLTDWDSNTGTFSHISHMYTVFPGKQIDPITNSALANAAIVTLNKVGNVDYGWPIAWRIGTAARLFDATRAMNQINLLLSWRGLWNSLQGRNIIFQIDANLGGAAAIVEMFVQSHNGELRLLPAVPSQIPSGTITGTRLRGGFILDTLQWSGGVLSTAVLRATINGAKITARLGRGSKTYAISLNSGQTVTFKASDFTGSTTPVTSTSTGGTSTVTSTTSTVPTSTVTTTSSSSSSTTTSSGGNCAALYGQCGGIGWTGATCCSSGTCKYSNDWYSQCL